MTEETYRRIFKSGTRYEAFSDAKNRESVLEALAVRLNNRLPDIGYEEAVRYASIIIERATDFTRCEDYLDGSDIESVYRRIVEYADGEDESVRCDIFSSIISMLDVGANVNLTKVSNLYGRDSLKSDEINSSVIEHMLKYAGMEENELKEVLRARLSRLFIAPSVLERMADNIVSKADEINRYKLNAETSFDSFTLLCTCSADVFASQILEDNDADIDNAVATAAAGLKSYEIGRRIHEGEIIEAAAFLAIGCLLLALYIFIITTAAGPEIVTASSIAGIAIILLLCNKVDDYVRNIASGLLNAAEGLRAAAKCVKERFHKKSETREETIAVMDEEVCIDEDDTFEYDI